MLESDGNGRQPPSILVNILPALGSTLFLLCLLYNIRYESKRCKYFVSLYLVHAFTFSITCFATNVNIVQCLSLYLVYVLNCSSLHCTKLYFKIGEASTS